MKIILNIYRLFTIPCLRSGLLFLIFTIGLAQLYFNHRESFSVIAELHQARDRYEKWPQLRTRLLQEVRTLKNKVAEAGATVYPYAKDNLYFAEMMAYGANKKLTIDNWNTEEITFHENYVAVNTRMKVIGTPQVLLQFLDHFENSSNPVNLKTLSLTKIKKSTRVNLSLKLEVLFRR